MRHYEESIRGMRLMLEYLPHHEVKRSLRLLPMVRTRMAEILEKRGWIQNRLDDYNGSVCLVGAMRAAVHEVGQEPLIGSAGTLLGVTELSLMEDLQEYTENSGLYLAEWNDQPGRTAAEVIAFLRRDPLVASPVVHEDQPPVDEPQVAGPEILTSEPAEVDLVAIG